jgi:hypothetical protein
MSDPNGCEYWQAGELPLAGATSQVSGGMEFWQAGELPPALALSGASAPATTRPRVQVIII